MRKIVTIALLFFCFTTTAQELKENNIDEFTKHSVKRTSWEKLRLSTPLTLTVRISKIDTSEFLDAKMIVGSGTRPFLIKAGDKFMIMLENDSVINLNNSASQVSCTGCGVNGLMGSGLYGVSISYVLCTEDHNALKKYSVKKIRVYTSDGYQQEELGERKSTVLKDLVALVE